MNVSNSTNVYKRYPDGLLLKRFLPSVYILKFYFSPIWFIVGLIGNTVSFCIWVSKRQRGKNSSAVYLATLSLNDLLLIFCLVSEYLRIYLLANHILSIDGMCQVFQGLFLFLQYYSIALTFGFTLERWIAICYPFQRHQLCSTSRAMLSVSILGVIVACFSVFFAFTWEVLDGACVLADEWQSMTAFSIYLTTTECVFSLIIPIATLVFNILVLREIGHLVDTKLTVGRGNFSNRRNTSLSSRIHRMGQNCDTAARPADAESDDHRILGSKHSSAQASAKEQANFQAATLMLVILSFYLILCTLPVGVVFVVQMQYANVPEEISDEEILASPVWQQYLRFLTAKEVIDFLCSSHYACNFIIYLVTGKSFRQQLLDIIFCRPQQTRPDLVTSLQCAKGSTVRGKLQRNEKVAMRNREESLVKIEPVG